MNRRNILRWLALLFFVGVAPTVRADSLDANIVGLLPKNVAEVGYADLERARQLSWFAQFKQQALPASYVEFEQFLKSSHIDPNTQIRQVAWAMGIGAPDESRDIAPATDDILGVALGDFDPESVRSLYKSRKLATSELRGYALYACGNGASCSGMFFLFLDTNTMAFGRRESLERMLAVRSGEEESVLANQSTFPLIQQANGEGIFWGVLNPAGTRMAIRQLVPEASQFRESGKLLARMKALVVTIKGTSSMDADFQMVSDSPLATTLLSQLLQAGLVVRRYEASRTKSALAPILDSIQVAPYGNTLDVSFSISNEQANLLIASNLFSMKL
jgi:hypothetical protein